MKIWLVITDNDGGVNPEAFSNEGAAAVRFQDLVAESWARHLPGEDWPDNPDDAYVRLSSLAGFEDYVSVREVEVADPPKRMTPTERAGLWKEAAKEARAVLGQVIERLEMNNIDGEESPFIQDCETALAMLAALPTIKEATA